MRAHIHSPLRVVLALAMLVCAAAAHAQTTTVRDLTRLRGQGESVLRGIGLVSGLPGTGDSGKELVMARPLAQMLANSGNAPGDLRELERSKSVALVNLEVVIPREGARTDDAFDVRVSVLHSASSLRGGRLMLAALRGPFPGSPVYAIGSGDVEVDSDGVPTVGRVRAGARMVQDVLMPELGDTFDLVMHSQFAGHAATAQVAAAINGSAQALGPRVAVAVDDRVVRVTVPPAERADRNAFVADVLGSPVNMSLLDLPAQVVVNRVAGVIVVTGDVTILPGVIAHKNLTITTTVPAPIPTPADPLVRQERAVALATQPRPAEAARLNDLLAALRQLDLPVEDQIDILFALERAQRLSAPIVSE